MVQKAGFLKYKRELPGAEDVKTRVNHFNEFLLPSDDKLKKEQADRCMNCGVPFCHFGCPLGNRIPEFNTAVFNDEWEKAYYILNSTNNFPEFTGRICPAPCEASCVLSINNDPVAIEFIEKTIIEKAFEENWVLKEKRMPASNKKVAIIGSGPAGLSAADQLNMSGHQTIVFEKQDRPGGLLRYGIPDFKLEKQIIDRRIKLMADQGVEFVMNCEVGVDIKAEELLDTFDAILICTGSTVARDLNIEGRPLKNIHFAMELLEQSNRLVAGDRISAAERIDVKGKHIVVIGSGDTGSDCIGTANRMGAASITQLALMTTPPLTRQPDNPWPEWPMTFVESTSHQEGCDRQWALMTKRFITDDGLKVSGIEAVSVRWEVTVEGKKVMKEIPNTLRVINCDHVFLAIGYTQPVVQGLIEDIQIDLNDKNHVVTQNFRTSINKVFAAGDVRRGQSLVVWAIAEGRKAAEAINQFLLAEDSTVNRDVQSPMCV